MIAVFFLGCCPFGFQRIYFKVAKTMAVELLQQLKTSLEGTTNVQAAMYAYLMFTSINYHFFDMWLLRVPSP
jgi:hypothetical protein